MNLLENVKKQLLQSIPFDVKWNDNLSQPFNAHIKISDWHITVEIKPDIEDRVDDNGLCSLIYTLIKHEEGHWKICPFDGQHHLEIRASVIRACKERFGNEMTMQKEGTELCGLVVNMFEDLVVDKSSILTNDNYKRGMEIILEVIRLELNNQKSNLFKLMFALRESFLLGKEALTDEINETLKTLSGNLNVRETWPKISYKFAMKIFSIISPDLAAGALSMDEIQSAKEGLTSESIQEKRFNNDEAYKEDEVKEYYRRKEEEAEKNSAVELSKEWSPLFDEAEALDIFFESKTEDMKLKYYERKATAYPIAYLGKRKLSDDKPFSVSRIKWSATKIIKRGDDVSIDLYEKETPIYHESGQDVDKTFFDLALILDSSSSMGSVYDRSSYFFVLVTAIYSLLRHLRETGKDIYINYCVINFSSKTWYSGWKEYRELKDLKRKYILSQQFAGTELNPVAINTMISESKGTFLSIMVTDGILENINPAVNAIGKLISEGNEFCLIEIGDLSEELRAGVERAGGNTYTVNQVSDLSALILEQGRKYWKST